MSINCVGVACKEGVLERKRLREGGKEGERQRKRVRERKRE